MYDVDTPRAPSAHTAAGSPLVPDPDQMSKHASHIPRPRVWLSRQAARGSYVSDQSDCSKPHGRHLNHDITGRLFKLTSRSKWVTTLKLLLTTPLISATGPPPPLSTNPGSATAFLVFLPLTCNVLAYKIWSGNNGMHLVLFFIYFGTCFQTNSNEQLLLRRHNHYTF